MDRRGAAEHRTALLAGLSGSVVEVGAGAGSNFAHYPPEVTSVLALEPEHRLRAAAEQSAAEKSVAGWHITVVAGSAEHISAPDGTFDAAVCSLVLCSVPDQAAALTEIRRVLRPGGQLRFYEHVRSANRLLALTEDLITPLYRHLAGNCHPNRDTLAAITAAGFEIEQVDRFGFAPLAVSPKMAHIIGRAQ